MHREYGRSNMLKNEEKMSNIQRDVDEELTYGRGHGAMGTSHAFMRLSHCAGTARVGQLSALPFAPIGLPKVLRVGRSRMVGED